VVVSWWGDWNPENGWEKWPPTPVHSWKNLPPSTIIPIGDGHLRAPKIEPNQRSKLTGSKRENWINQQIPLKFNMVHPENGSPPIFFSEILTLESIVLQFLCLNFGGICPKIRINNQQETEIGYLLSGIPRSHRKTSLRTPIASYHLLRAVHRNFCSPQMASRCCSSMTSSSAVPKRWLNTSKNGPASYGRWGCGWRWKVCVDHWPLVN